jgi:hypothetical protein
MAKRVKIKTSENTYTHFCFKNEYTLCGLDIEDNDSSIVKVPKKFRLKVDCPHCSEIVSFSKAINKNEFSKELKINKK